MDFKRLLFSFKNSNVFLAFVVYFTIYSDVWDLFFFLFNTCMSRNF